jgi:DNA-binding NarL/FixJ family response regulator
VLDDTGDDAGAAAVVAEIEGQLASLPEGARAQRARLERLRRRLSAERGAPPAQTLTSRETAILNMLRGP